MTELKTRKIAIGIVGALFIMIISQLCSQLIASLLVIIHIPIFLCNMVAGIMYIVFTLLISNQFIKRILKCESKDLSIPRFDPKIGWIVTAVLLPASITVIYLLMPGDLQSSGMSTIQVLETISAGVFFVGLGAGIVEEIVFRGIIMNLIQHKWGRKAAIIIPSVLFGLVHIIGMNFNLLSCLQVLVAGTAVGIMFSLITLHYNSIWNSAMVHSVWNTIIIGGIISIGEKADSYSIYSYVLDTDKFAITGGEFGIESSIIAIVGYTIVSIIAYMGIKRNIKK